MKYIDIISESISHFTDIPVEFVKTKFNLFDQSHKDKELLDMVLAVDFPEREASILLDDLKKGSLKGTIAFLIESISILKKETEIQSIVN